MEKLWLKGMLAWLHPGLANKYVLAFPHSYEKSYFYAYRQEIRIRVCGVVCKLSIRRCCKELSWWDEKWVEKYLEIKEKRGRSFSSFHVLHLEQLIQKLKSLVKRKQDDLQFSTRIMPWTSLEIKTLSHQAKIWPALLQDIVWDFVLYQHGYKKQKTYYFEIGHFEKNRILMRSYKIHLVADMYYSFSLFGWIWKHTAKWFLSLAVDHLIQTRHLLCSNHSLLC